MPILGHLSDSRQILDTVPLVAASFPCSSRLAFGRRECISGCSGTKFLLFAVSVLHNVGANGGGAEGGGGGIFEEVVHDRFI